MNFLNLPWSPVITPLLPDCWLTFYNSKVLLGIHPISLAYSLKKWTAFTFLKMETFICPLLTCQQDICSLQFFKDDYLWSTDVIWAFVCSCGVETSLVFKALWNALKKTSLPGLDFNFLIFVFSFLIWQLTFLTCMVVNILFIKNSRSWNLNSWHKKMNPLIHVVRIQSLIRLNHDWIQRCKGCEQSPSFLASLEPWFFLC